MDPAAARTGGWAQRTAWWLALACVVLSTAVFVRRGAEAWQAAGVPPGTAETSGCEEESFFALWRAVHAQPVFTDSTRLPFSSAYFNWLFYAGYRWPLGAAVAAHGDAVIPRASRLTTAAGALAGTVWLAFCLGATARRWWLLAAAVSSFVFFGPLVGWWAHTARPDVWALAFETGGLAALVVLFARRPAAACAVALVCFYAAWACKPTFVFALTTSVLFLAWRRQWRWAAFLGVGSVAAWLLTLVAMGAEYRSALQATAVTNVFSWHTGAANLYDMVRKAAPLLLLAGLTLFPRHRAVDTGLLVREAHTLGIIGVLVSLALAFLASCKVGAYSNYYFTLTLMLALVGFTAAVRTQAALPVALACGLAGLLQLACLTGVVGRISLQPAAAELAGRWRGWQQQPEPRFAADLRLNLPWLAPHSPPLVPGFNYHLERAAGRTFEAGGIGGMIEAGAFASLLLPGGTTDRYDSGHLLRYRAGVTVEGMRIFHRVENSASAP